MAMAAILSNVDLADLRNRDRKILRRYALSVKVFGREFVDTSLNLVLNELRRLGYTGYFHKEVRFTLCELFLVSRNPDALHRGPSLSATACYRRRHLGQTALGWAELETGRPASQQRGVLEASSPASPLGTYASAFIGMAFCGSQAGRNPQIETGLRATELQQRESSR